MKKFLFGTFLITLLALICSYFLNDVVFKGILHRELPAAIFFFFGQSLVVAWLYNLSEKEGWKNPIYTLAAVTFRLLTALFFILVLYAMKPEDIKSLMLQFVILYLVYLIFELFAVLPNLRRN
ncbi:hypothetical protein [Marinoscillum sp. MHG1-6]|uniref:hypothetical protein n=1 Tax=Marinoscillum sp. MHG1-6 TaxID=2959627 RepID=UPI00215827FB|nr:hypothetical protein [Marinoscillum sp. MHG1-6]